MNNDIVPFGSSTELKFYEVAKFNLAQAKSTDEIKDIKDKAAAIELYAKQAKDTSLEADAFEIRKRAERRIGELMREQKEKVGLHKGGQPPKNRGPEDPGSLPPTLKAAGIDKNLAKRARVMARIPKEMFENGIQQTREKIEQQVRTSKVAKVFDDIGPQPKDLHDINKFLVKQINAWDKFLEQQAMQKLYELVKFKKDLEAQDAHRLASTLTKVVAKMNSIIKTLEGV